MTEQTVGWALHALEPDEELTAVEHLAGCARCQRVAAEVSDLTVNLATAVPQHDPPPRLRDAIVDTARRTPQVGGPGVDDDRPVPGDRLPAPSAPRGARPGAGRSGAGATRPPSGPGRGSRRYGRLLVAAAVALVVVLGGGAAVGQMRSLQAERDAGLAQARQMEQVLGQLATPGTQHAFLREGGTTVAAVLMHDGQRSVVPMGLRPNDTGAQTYVLWGLDGDAAPKAVGTFDVRPEGGGPVSVPSGDGGTFAQYAVSLERGRTAPDAPSSVVAAGQVET